jgi:C4-type Zn-finger protein
MPRGLYYDDFVAPWPPSLSLGSLVAVPIMDTTIDIPCPKCGYYVTCAYRQGLLHSGFNPFKPRVSFLLECRRCGFRKSYRLLSGSKLARMYAPASETPD